MKEILLLNSDIEQVLCAVRLDLSNESGRAAHSEVRTLWKIIHLHLRSHERMEDAC